jgi:hypothetical protein
VTAPYRGATLLRTCDTLSTVLFLLLPSLAWASPCEVANTAAQLQTSVASAEVAFVNMDAEHFRKEVEVAVHKLECVSEPITPGVAGGVHRVQALSAFLERNHLLAIGHFQALLAVEPGYTLNETLAPPGHPLRDDFEEAGGKSAGPPKPLPVVAGSTYRIDGIAGTSAPSDRPYVLQTLDARSTVVSTKMVNPIEPWPHPDEDFTMNKPPPKHPARAPLLVTAGLTGLIAGTFYALAADREADFWNESTPDTRLQALRQETNIYASLAIGLGGVAVGTGTAAVLTGTF